MKVEEWFGVNAGKVWKALKEMREQTAEELTKITNLRTAEVYGALGWLAREGKIKVEKIKGIFKFKLTE